jgi:succinate dehydrogenase/fumarate reductase flavoprotein subunit
MDKMLMKKMKQGKEDGKMSARDVSSKEEVLQELIEAMQSLRAGHLKNGMDEQMQKVSVMAPDKEHLEEGLEKAQEMIGDMPEMSMSEDEEVPMEEEDEVVAEPVVKDEEEDDSGQTLFRKRR